MGLDMDSDIFDLAGDLEMDSQSAVAPNADSTIVFEAPCADSFAQPSDGEKAEQSIWSEEEPSQDDNPLGGDDLDQDLLDAFDQIKQSEDETPKAATPSSDPPKSILPVDPFAPASIRTEEVSASGLGLSGAEKKVDDAAKTAEEDAFEDFFQMPDK
jgi:hypothetical protein